jgi:hypothetical protein
MVLIHCLLLAIFSQAEKVSQMQHSEYALTIQHPWMNHWYKFSTYSTYTLSFIGQIQPCGKSRSDAASQTCTQLLTDE